MTIIKPILSVCLSASLSLGSMPLMLSSAAAQEFVQGVVDSVHGDWQIRCDRLVGAAQKQCVLVQNATAEGHGDIWLTVLIVKATDRSGSIMRILAPLDVYLTAGLGLQIDDKDVGRVGYVRCLKLGCYAEVNIQDDLVSQLEDGEKAAFTVYNSPEDGISIPFSLKGFREGFDDLPGQIGWRN